MKPFREAPLLLKSLRMRRQLPIQQATRDRNQNQPGIRGDLR